MNAALKRERESSEDAYVSTNEKDSLPAQVEGLRADVRHLQSDVTDIKADIRDVRGEIKDVRSEIKDVRGEIKDVRGEIRDTNKRIDHLIESLASAKVWAICLYVAFAGSMLYVMARGFKWL